jgi:hypothetical protein
MSLRKRVGGISVLLFLATIGIVFGSMPRNWIELRFGIDPDGGSGVVELLLAAVPIGVCVALAIRRFVRNRSLAPEGVMPLRQTHSLHEN